MRRWLRHTTPRQRVSALTVIVVLAFVAGLAVWSRSGSSPSVALPDASPTTAVPSATDGVPTPTASGSSTSPAPGASGSGTPAAGLAALPALPESTSVTVDGLPQHAVTIVVTSDEPIAFVGYRVANGRPATRTYQWPRSPVRIETVGRGTGAMGAVIAQAGPYADSLACSVSVDGKVVSMMSIRKAAYRTVYCGG